MKRLAILSIVFLMGAASLPQKYHTVYCKDSQGDKIKTIYNVVSVDTIQSRFGTYHAWVHTWYTHRQYPIPRFEITSEEQEGYKFDSLYDYPEGHPYYYENMRDTIEARNE